MAPSHVQLAAELPLWELKSIPFPGVAFVNLGTPTTRPAKDIIISSTVDQELIFCFDGTSTDQLRIPPGDVVPQVIQIPFRSFNAALPAQKQIQVRSAVAAASGQVSVTLISAVSQ